MARRFKRDNFLFPIDLRQARGEVVARPTDPFETASEGIAEQAPNRPFELQRPSSRNSLAELADSLGVAGSIVGQVSDQRYEEYTQRMQAEGARLASQEALTNNKRSFKQAISETRANFGDEAARDLMKLSPHLKKGFDQTRARSASIEFNAALQSEYASNPIIDEESGTRLHDIDLSDPRYAQWESGFTQAFQAAQGVNTLDPVAQATFFPAVEDATTRVGVAHDELRSTRRLQVFEDATSEFTTNALMELTANPEFQAGTNPDLIVSTANLITQQIDEANSLGYGGEDLRNIYAQVVAQAVATAIATGDEKLLDVLELVEVGNPSSRRMLLDVANDGKYRTAVVSARDSIQDREYRSEQRERQQRDQNREDTLNDIMQALAVAGGIYEGSGRTPESRAILERTIDAGRLQATQAGVLVAYNNGIAAVLQDSVDTVGVPLVDYEAMNHLEANITNGQIGGEAAQRRLNDLFSSGALGTGEAQYQNYQRINSKIKNTNDNDFQLFSRTVDDAAGEYETVLKGRLGYTEDANGRVRTVRETLQNAGFTPDDMANLMNMSPEQLEEEIAANLEAAAVNEAVPFSGPVMQAMNAVVIGGINPLEEPKPIDPGEISRQTIAFKNRMYAERERFVEENGRAMTPEEVSQFTRATLEAELSGQRALLPSSNPLSSRGGPSGLTEAREDFYSDILGDVGSRSGNARNTAVLDQFETAKAFDYYITTGKWHPGFVTLADANGLTPMALVQSQLSANGISVRDDLALRAGIAPTPEASSYPSTPSYSSLASQRSTFKVNGRPLNNLAAQSVSIASDYVGRGFGNGEDAQCAYFVRHVFERMGIDLPVSTDRVSSLDPEAGQFGAGFAVSLIGSDVGAVYRTSDISQIPPGAIVGFTNTYGNFPTGAITHVGISTGNGQIIDMPTANGVVQHRGVNTFPPASDGKYVYVVPHQLIDKASSSTGATSSSTGATATRNTPFWEALVGTAGRLGVTPLELAAVLQQESSLDIGAYNGSRPGDPNGYEGLFQASRDVRSRYGVYAGQPAHEQLAAFERYMKDRGYRPGMGMEGLYATILVGNPQNRSSSGVYNPSDSNGTNVLNSLPKFKPGGIKYREAAAFFGITE